MEVIFYCFDLGFGIDEVGVWLTLYQHLSAVSADLPALSVRSCKGSVVRVAIMRLENVGVSITGNSTNAMKANIGSSYFLRQNLSALKPIPSLKMTAKKSAAY